MEGAGLGAGGCEGDGVVAAAAEGVVTIANDGTLCANSVVVGCVEVIL